MNHSHHNHHPVQTNNTGLPNIATTVPSLPSTTVNDHAHHIHNHQDHHTATSHDSHVMKMWFHGGASETVLFEWWKVETYWGLLFSCIAICLMAVAYEGIKWIRVYLHNIQLAKERQASNHCPKLALSDVQSQADEVLLNKNDIPGENATMRSDEIYKSTVTRENNRNSQCRFEKFLRRLDILSPSPCSMFRILQTVLYIIQILLAYWLMLVAMTYNTWLTAAVVLGCGLGHWIFAISNFVRFSNDNAANAFAADVCH